MTTEEHKDHGKKVAEMHFEGYEDGSMHTHIEGNGGTLMAIIASAVEDDEKLLKLLVTAIAFTKMKHTSTAEEKVASPIVN